MGEITNLNALDVERAQQTKPKTVRCLTCAETAKLVREALKAAFPGMTFSVKSRHHTAIDVTWTDGPTETEVEAVTHHFEGATYDSSQDLKGYQARVIGDERVHYGADWVCLHREFSPEALTEFAAVMAERYGVPAPEVKHSSWTDKGKEHHHYWLDNTGGPVNPYDLGSDPGTVAMRIGNETSKYTKPA